MAPRHSRRPRSPAAGRPAPGSGRARHAESAGEEGAGGGGAGLAAPAPRGPDFQPPTLALPASAPLSSPGPCLPCGLCCCLPRVSSWLRVTPDMSLIIGGQRGGEQQKYSTFTSPPHPELLSALHRGIARKLYNRSLPIDHPLPPKTTSPKKGEEVSRNPGGWPWTLARWKPWSCRWPVKTSSLGWDQFWAGILAEEE